MMMCANKVFFLAFLNKRPKSTQGQIYPQAMSIARRIGRVCCALGLILGASCAVGAPSPSPAEQATSAEKTAPARKPILAEKPIYVPMDLSQWQFKGTPFECQLVHQDVMEGAFSFKAEPPHRLVFQADLTRLKQRFSAASLYYQDPAWSSEIVASAPLAHVSLDAKQQARFSVGIDTLLTRMQTGSWIGLRLAKATLASSSSNATASAIATTTEQALIIPALQLARTIDRFQQCRRALPEISYAQARTMTLPFAFGQRQLSSSQQKTIQDFVSYVRVDKRITHILIDAHTDNIGSSVSNLMVARQRAEIVAAELKKRGVKANLLQVRAHGERYPLASNQTEAGRAKNRRVTLRLVRDNETITTAQAAFNVRN